MMEELKCADELELLPTPREIDLDETRYELDEWELVASVDHPFTDVAIAEINDRLTDLESAPLPVRERPSGDPAILLGRWLDPGIRDAAMALDVTVTPSDPGEQGYVIAFGEHEDRPIALLAGSDAQGMLYAAVTFRRLLERADDENGESGGVRGRSATIRDWPDFKVRNVGRLPLRRLQRTTATASDLTPLDDTAADLKREIDFWLRHKVNCVVGQMFFPDDDTDPGLFDAQVERASAVLDYADERGIDVRYVGGVDISEHLTEDERERAIERAPGSSYDWAAFDAHRTHARRYADFLADVGGDVFSLHLDDQGGYIDPERWSERSEATRDMYGDDRATASEEQFQLYFESMRDAVGDISLEAIPYPYHFQFARDDFPDRYEDLRDSPAFDGLVAPIRDSAHAAAIQERLMEYHRHLADVLSDDVSIVFREADETTFEAATALYPDHPFTIWIYPGRNHGWQGTFTPQARMAKTFYRPNHRDTFFLAAGYAYGDGRVQQLAQQEYLWETRRVDGVGRFNQRKRGFEVGGKISPIQRGHLVPRIARILYGDAAPGITELLAANASFRYVDDPVGTSCRQHDAEDFHQVYDRMAGQAAAFAEAHEAIADVFSRIGEPHELGPPVSATGDVHAWLAFYYRYTGLARIKSEIEAAAAECRNLLCKGRMHEAIGIGESAIKDLPPTDVTCEELIDATSGELPTQIDGLDEFEPLAYESDFARLVELAESLRDGGGLKTHMDDRVGERKAIVTAEAMYRTDRTVTYGYATVIGLNIGLVTGFELWEDLAKHDIVITIADEEGNRITEERRPGQRFHEAWIIPRPVTIDLGDPYAGDLEIDISLDDDQPLDRYVLTEDGDLKGRGDDSV